jgi:prolyl-tRNA synthetase
VNYGRDFEAEIVTDIAAAEEGFGCPNCGSPMKESRGVEVGNIFKLGTKYTKALGANYLDKNGKSKPIVMGSYGIGSGRLLASIAEEHNDEQGLIWPISVAPYHVHLISLRGGQEESDKLYDTLSGAGIEVIYDDRNESPGVKFNDADLIGVPIRITIGERSLKQNTAELKIRKEEEREQIPLKEVVEYVKKVKSELESEILAAVVDMPLKD